MGALPSSQGSYKVCRPVSAIATPLTSTWIRCTQIHWAALKQIFPVSPAGADLMPGLPVQTPRSTTGGHSCPQSTAISHGGSRIRACGPHFLSFPVISAHNCLFKNTEFLWSGSEGHSGPQTKNFLLIICLGKALSHTPAGPRLMPSSQLLRLGCVRVTELLQPVQESDHIVLRTSKMCLKGSSPSPGLSDSARWAKFISTNTLASRQQVNPYTESSVHTMTISFYPLHPAVMLRISKSSSLGKLKSSKITVKV